MANMHTGDAQALGRIEGALDMLKELVSEVREDQKEVAAKAVELATRLAGSADHEKRIQELERDKSYVRGWIGAAGAIGGAVAAVIVWILNFLTHGKG